jgi:hypothetical protein
MSENFQGHLLKLEFKYFTYTTIKMILPSTNIIQVWTIYMFVCLVVFNATFNNISVISWLSVLLVEETGGPGENH